MASKRTRKTTKKKTGRTKRVAVKVTIDLDELERLYRNVHSLAEGDSKGDGDTKSARVKGRRRSADGDTKSARVKPRRRSADGDTKRGPSRARAARRKKR